MSWTLLVVGLVAQVKKSDKNPPAKLKGQLPVGWHKLGLSQEQMQKVNKVQADYRGRLDKLEEQVDALKKQRQGEMEKVFTAAQRARLRELKDTDPDKDDPKNDEKKATKDKKNMETKK